jgi:DNA-directed RNA polymerase specialized sigma subunit
MNETNKEKKELGKLKRDCKSWTPLDWESYLKTIECDQKEILLGNKIDNFSQDAFAYNVNNTLSDERIEQFKTVMNSLLTHLTDKQRKVMIEFFWNGKNICEISRETGLGRTALQNTKTRGLEKMAKVLQAISMRKGSTQRGDAA